MRGGFYLALAVFSLVGLLPSLAWAFAILFDAPVPDLRWQFAVFLLPLTFCTLALYPRHTAERLLQAAASGLHPSNRRRALAATGFRPYRPRRFRLRNFRIRGQRRILLAMLSLTALGLASRLILPAGFFLAFVLCLRRSAWLGDRRARQLEEKVLGVRGPACDPARTLAGTGRHR